MQGSGGSASRHEPAQTRQVDEDRATAFRRLVDLQLDPNYRIANAILANHAEAQDAVHDALVIAWRKYHHLRDPAKFDAWFRHIVVNACRGRLRQAARRPTTDLSERSELSSPDISPAVDERVRLEQALARLKPDDQIILALRYNHDLKLDDIAAALDIPSGTVKSRLNRAHAGLRKLLGDGKETPR